jgi:predicted phage terminase large subunit-like protein
MAFVKKMWPGFIHGRHHAVVAKAFEEIASGKIKRLAISMPPRHTKSEFGSYMLPAWFLGKFSDKKVMQASNTGELAVGFGRKVRNLVMSEQYHEVFPNTKIRQDSKSAGRWAVNEVGEYFAIGVGGTMTGRGADLVIIDDPHTEGEAALAAHDPSVYDRAYEWYTSGPRQRLQPNGAIIIIACMTGETKVLMADGTEKELRHIKVGDLVATYENDRLATSKVLNWKSQGFDDILKITTTSGKIVRANKKHPFLVEQNGVREWIRVKNLKIGQSLIGFAQQRGAQGQGTPKDCAALATKTKHGQREKLGLHPKLRQGQPQKDKQTTSTRLDTGESGKESSAQQMDAVSLQKQKGSATLVTCKKHGLMEKIATLLMCCATTVLSLATALLRKSTKPCSESRKESAPSASSPQTSQTQGSIKKCNCVSTTATTQKRCEGFSATTAILPSDTPIEKRCCDLLLNTSDFTLDAIVEIEIDGCEEVFDVEIERTENFIANGLVSHNTRWSETDLIGRVLKDAAERGKPDEWRVIEFPAILPSGNPLWPEFWPLEQLEALKEELPPMKWNAQYQQKPTGEEGALIKRDWWNVWEKDEPPRCEFIIQAWDTAFTKNERSDFSACTTWGVFFLNEDPNNPNIILLDSFQKRMEFPELKEKAREHYLEWEPDDCIIEAKAAGASLIQELNQQSDIFVRGYTPSRGTRQQSNDKIARMNSVSPIFQGGKVWAPDTRWARELIDQMASFPNAAHDDLADTAVMAITRFRQGGFLRLESDAQDEPTSFRRKTAFY